MNFSTPLNHKRKTVVESLRQALGACLVPFRKKCQVWISGTAADVNSFPVSAVGLGVFWRRTGTPGSDPGPWAGIGGQQPVGWATLVPVAAARARDSLELAPPRWPGGLRIDPAAATANSIFERRTGTPGSNPGPWAGIGGQQPVGWATLVPVAAARARDSLELAPPRWPGGR